MSDKTIVNKVKRASEETSAEAKIPTGAPRLTSSEADHSEPIAVDRPGLDLGGSTGGTTAGTGVGLGPNSSELAEDRSLPNRHAKPTETIPRWSGAEGVPKVPNFITLLSRK